MERISANGAEFEVEQAGTGEPLLLIHGSIIGDAYEPLLSESALTSRYRLIQYHRRGFCGSSRPPRPRNSPRSIPFWSKSTKVDKRHSPPGDPIGRGFCISCRVGCGTGKGRANAPFIFACPVWASALPRPRLSPPDNTV